MARSSFPFPNPCDGCESELFDCSKRRLIGDIKSTCIQPRMVRAAKFRRPPQRSTSFIQITAPLARPKVAWSREQASVAANYRPHPATSRFHLCQRCSPCQTLAASHSAPGLPGPVVIGSAVPIDRSQILRHSNDEPLTFLDEGQCGCSPARSLQRQGMEIAFMDRTNCPIQESDHDAACQGTMSKREAFSTTNFFKHVTATVRPGGTVLI